LRFKAGGAVTTSSFVNRVIWSLIFFVSTTLLLLIVEMGTFGATAQMHFRIVWHPLHAIYWAHKEAADFAIVLIGTSVTAVTGGLAVLKTFYYAEMNLPKRLQELTERARDEHLHDRPRLLEYVQGPFKTKGFLVPTILANPFSQVLQLFGWVSLRNKARGFATTVEKFDGEIKVVAAKKEDIENRKVTAHLLRGACFAAQASESERSSLDWRKSLEKSLAEYEAALALRNEDLDALEGAALQSEALADSGKHLHYLDTIIVVADKQKKPLQRARALRKTGVIIDARNSPDAWNIARGRLLAAWRLLDRKWDNDAPEAVELAETLLLYGDVQTKREKFSAARTALVRADALFGSMTTEAGKAGSGRVKQAVERLDEASGG
jgi:hypothetical protein